MSYGICETPGCFRLRALVKVAHVDQYGQKYGTCQSCRDKNEKPAVGHLTAVRKSS